MAPTLLSLNFDVLSTILPLISSHDAAQLALTCRSAYALALPRFLSDVTLGGLYYKPGGSAVSQLTAFCNFMLAPAPSWHGAPTARLDGLRSLEVMRDAVRVRKDGAWAVDPAAASLLSAVLARAHGLQRLTLWGSDALFAACPDFGSGSGPSIDTLVLGGDIAPLPLLARAFPHVRSIVFAGAGGSFAPGWAHFAAGADADSDALGPWRGRLERVDTGFAVVPLACPVRCVEMRNPLADGYDFLPAREFLGQTKPVVLSLPVNASMNIPPMAHAGTLELATPSLRFLELTGDRCEGLAEAADWVKVCRCFISAFPLPRANSPLSPVRSESRQRSPCFQRSLCSAYPFRSRLLLCPPRQLGSLGRTSPCRRCRRKRLRSPWTSQPSRK